MKNKKGISLIVLIVTIIVIIILAAAVILTLNENNPIDSSRVAQLADNRANINSAVNLYYGKQMAVTQGIYDADDIFTHSYVKDGETKVSLVTDTTVTIDGIVLNQIDTTKTSDLLGLTLPTVANASWYLDINSALVYLVYNADATIPAWMFTDTEADVMDATLATFVKQAPKV